LPLPNSYTLKVGAIPAYFEGILNAEAPERFSYKFLEGIGFSSSNDRLLIGILKELGFLNADGAPQDRYFRFLDRSSSEKVVAEGVREAYSDLFAVNKSAHELIVDDAYNKLRTLYKGGKKDTVIKHIAKTFRALCDYADFSAALHPPIEKNDLKDFEDQVTENVPTDTEGKSKIGINALQDHINIVLPDTRDQAVYDAIFKSLRDHLG